MDGSWQCMYELASLYFLQVDRPDIMCSSVYEFNTADSHGVDLEHLPIVDFLPPLPHCQLGSCQIELGPLCFTQDLYHTSGG